MREEREPYVNYVKLWTVYLTQMRSRGVPSVPGIRHRRGDGKEGALGVLRRCAVVGRSYSFGTCIGDRLAGGKLEITQDHRMSV